MKRTKKVLIIIFAVLALWGCLLGFDWYRVTVSDAHTPVFSIRFNPEKHHYTGLGYSFDVYDHPVTGYSEYAFYLFGNLVTSTFTD